MNNPIYATELVELINEKSREHSNPQNRFEYFNLMAQLARHEARHAEVLLMNKNKHVHAEVEVARGPASIRPVATERDRGIDEIADILQRANGSEIAELAVQLYDAGYRKGELR